VSFLLTDEDFFPCREALREEGGGDELTERG